MDLRPIKLVKLAIIGAGAAGFGYVLWKYLGQNGAPVKLLILIPLVPAALLYAGVDWIDNRSRRVRVAARLEQIGFKPEDPGAHGRDILYTLPPKHQSFAMRLFAEAQWHGRRARVMEFEFAVGHGEGRQAWKIFQAAIECPGDWPAFELLAVPGSFQFVPDKDYKRGDKLGDAAFDRLWRIAGDVPGATAILMPPLRDWLRSRSFRESWQVRDGWLVCSWRGTCDERRAEQSLARVAMFLSKAGKPAPAGVVE